MVSLSFVDSVLFLLGLLCEEEGGREVCYDVCGGKLTTGCLICRRLVWCFRRGKSMQQMMLWCGRRRVREDDSKGMLEMMHVIL